MIFKTNAHYFALQHDRVLFVMAARCVFRNESLYVVQQSSSLSVTLFAVRPSHPPPCPPVPQPRPSLFPPAPSLFITLGLVLLINFKILSWTLAGVRHKDRLTDWLTDDQPTVRRNVILTFRQSKGHNILPTNCFYISRMIFTINRQCFTIQHSPVVILVEAYCSLLGTNWIFRLILADANIGSLAHLASYSVGTRSEAVQACSWPLISI